MCVWLLKSSGQDRPRTNSQVRGYDPCPRPRGRSGVLRHNLCIMGEGFLKKRIQFRNKNKHLSGKRSEISINC